MEGTPSWKRKRSHSQGRLLFASLIMILVMVFWSWFGCCDWGNIGPCVCFSAGGLEGLICLVCGTRQGRKTDFFRPKGDDGFEQVTAYSTLGQGGQG